MGGPFRFKPKTALEIEVALLHDLEYTAYEKKRNAWHYSPEGQAEYAERQRRDQEREEEAILEDAFLVLERRGVPEAEAIRRLWDYGPHEQPNQ